MNNVMRPLDVQTADYLGAIVVSNDRADADLVQAVLQETPERVTTMHCGLPLKWVGDCPELVLPSGRQVQVKRLADIVLALVGLLVLAPLLLLVAALVAATSPGPVLFRQQREGLGGKLFWALKFRSMQSTCCDRSGVAQTRKHDPRLTPVGAFIRRTSLDELPQLFNVLRGEMSLVGPRPHVPGMLAGGRTYRELVPFYEQRLALRPGLTGWAQANGLRGSTSDPVAARSRIEFDLAYGQNCSLWLDLKILVLTARNQFLTGSGE
ncbi:MAG: exopolysaccharide biosynthesis protein [Devosia sp.]|jgi:lipopolysaccharide/colanic/teichoic acid biosynthesis glycosyltransferase|nr:exopolysaccharide biosynthesis protein [Devosia sp.]